MTQTNEPAEITSKPTRKGRQPGKETNPENSARRLSDGVSRAIWYLSGSATSGLGILAARAAKQGISRERVAKGFEMVQEALDLARTQMEAAYAAPSVTRQPERPVVRL